MRLPCEWDEDDLKELIREGTQESIELDYKACGALARTDGKKKKEVSKDVSAFANSAGGTIVYGMIENGHIPVKLDVGYNPGDITKEWLDQVISSNIQRRIDGVRIKQVELRTTSPGKVVYVVHVPQSMRAPHQAADKRFYKRFNFESVPMEEYEIRDVARRSESPDLRLLCHVLPERGTLVAEGTTEKPSLQEVEVEWVIMNESVTPAEHVVIDLYIDRRLILVGALDSIELTRDDCSELQTVEGEEYVCSRLSRNWGKTMMPIFEGVIFRLTKRPLRFAVPGSEKYLLAWRLRSPRMSTKIGHFFLEPAGNKAGF